MLTEIDIKRALKSGQNTQLSDSNARGTGRLILRVKSGKADWYDYLDEKREAISKLMDWFTAKIEKPQ